MNSLPHRLTSNDHHCISVAEMKQLRNFAATEKEKYD